MTETISNRYLLVKKIGNGGMADVYLAMDTVLNREVAIKILRGDLSHDPVALLRFQREASAASGLDHSGIVDVYDVGEDDGRHYIVMEVIRGTTLKALIHRRGALDKFEAVAIMRQLAEALATAHHQGIIHRDIKPQNILVKDDGTAKITDFGIALAEDAIQLTKHDSVLGSVHYMAPELSRGEGASVQSDIYALGVVFYELLTGDVPYRGETPVEIAMKHMRDPFPLVQKFNPSLPNSIENIIAKSTCKNRAHRYTKIDDLIDDLRVCLDPEGQDEELWAPNLEDEDGTKLLDKLHTVKHVPADPKKEKRKKIMIYSGIAAAVLVVGLLVFWFMRPTSNEELTIPKLEGMTLQEATDALDAMGIHANPSVTYAYSDDHDMGIVISSKPGEGALVQKGSQVRLTVSQGKNFVVEDYKGKTLDEVRTLLSGKNISIRVVTESRKDMEPNIVIKQEGLEPGEKINPNQKRELVLYVSSYVEVQIPTDLIGTGVEAAVKQLEDLGIKTKIEVLSQDGLSLSEIANLKYNVVIRTDPTPGSYYVQDDSRVVTLYYYVKKEVEQPVDPKPDPEEKPNEEASNEETPTKPGGQT